MLSMLHGYLQLLVLEFFQIHDLLFEVSLFAESLKDDHIQLGNALFAFRYTFFHG
jgi:hypothetical protein